MGSCRVGILVVVWLLCTAAPVGVEARKSKRGKRQKGDAGILRATQASGQKNRAAFAQHGDRIRRCVDSMMISYYRPVYPSLSCCCLALFVT